MKLVDAIRRNAPRPWRGDWRQLVKMSAAAGLYYSGLTKVGLRALRRVDRRRRLVALVYHKVVPAHLSEAADGVRCEHFDSQIDVLSRLFDVGAPADASVSLTPAAKQSARYPMLVTFDDGYANNFLYALPILRAHRSPALFFVTTELLGTDRFIWTDEVRELMLQSPLTELRLNFQGADEVHPLRDRGERLVAATKLKARLKRLPHAEFVEHLDHIRQQSGVETLQHHEGTRMLSWSALRTVASSGVTVGSHSSRHCTLTNLPDDLLQTDLEESQVALEGQMGSRTPYFAYPNGHRADFDDRVAAAARSAGFTKAFTMERGIATDADDAMRLPRFAPSDEPGYLVAFELLRLLASTVVKDRLSRADARAPRQPFVVLRSRSTRPSVGRPAATPAEATR